MLSGLTGGHGELSFSLQDDLASVVHGWKHALLEENDVVLVQAEVIMSQEEVLSGLHCPATGHDVPEGNTGLSTGNAWEDFVPGK